MNRTERLAAAAAKIEAAAPELRALALRLLAGIDMSERNWRAAGGDALNLIMGQAWATWKADGRKGWGQKKKAAHLVDNCLTVLAGGQHQYRDMPRERQAAGLKFVADMIAA